MVVGEVTGVSGLLEIHGLRPPVGGDVLYSHYRGPFVCPIGLRQLPYLETKCFYLAENRIFLSLPRI